MSFKKMESKLVSLGSSFKKMDSKFEITSNGFNSDRKMNP